MHWNAGLHHLLTSSPPHLLTPHLLTPHLLTPHLLTPHHLTPHLRARAWRSGTQAPLAALLATHCWMKYIPSTPSLTFG